MRQAFLARFFPPSKTAQLRAKLYQFTQNDGESHYDPWERFKEMLRLCPHHGLEKWLIIHTFYNGLTYITKIIVDAAAGGALMNKDFTTTYALIEDMALKLYQWTDERAIIDSSASKEEACMNKISSLDHLSVKVDALFQKFDKINVSVITPISPPCGACGNLGHTSIECKLGSAVESIEQLNFIQNNQGKRSNQFFYKILQNPFGQKKALPGYANSERVTQKSSLKLLMENYFLNQSEQLQELKDQTRLLNDSLATLTLKVDSISSHNKILETQISQVVQKVSQLKTNKMNVVTLRNGRQLEDPVGKAKPNEIKKEISEPQGEETRVESEKPTTPPPFNPKIPFPQRFAKSNLDEQFKKFTEMMNKIYIDVPFTEVLTQVPTYAKFLKEILSKKGKLRSVRQLTLQMSVVPSSKTNCHLS